MLGKKKIKRQRFLYWFLILGSLNNVFIVAQYATILRLLGFFGLTTRPVSYTGKTIIQNRRKTDKSLILAQNER